MAEKMSDEAKKLWARLQVAQREFRDAKMDLEKCRQAGVQIEQRVNAARAEVHSIKDQLAALAAEE